MDGGSEESKDYQKIAYIRTYQEEPLIWSLWRPSDESEKKTTQRYTVSVLSALDHAFDTVASGCIMRNRRTW